MIDAADIPIIEPYRWTAIQSSNTWYAKTRIGGRTVYMHRLIVFGDHESETKMKVDHINRNGLDNRRLNLRPVTNSQNTMNSVGRVKRRRSAYKGVSFRPNSVRPWRAQIEVGGKQLHLGYFTLEVLAALSYDAAAIQHFGPYARLNFGDSATNVLTA